MTCQVSFTSGAKGQVLAQDFGLKVLSIKGLFRCDGWNGEWAEQAATLARVARDRGAVA